MAVRPRLPHLRYLHVHGRGRRRHAIKRKKCLIIRQAQHSTEQGRKIGCFRDRTTGGRTPIASFFPWATQTHRAPAAAVAAAAEERFPRPRPSASVKRLLFTFPPPPRPETDGRTDGRAGIYRRPPLRRPFIRPPRAIRDQGSTGPTTQRSEGFLWRTRKREIQKKFLGRKSMFSTFVNKTAAQQLSGDREKVMVDGHGDDDRRRRGGGDSSGGVTATAAAVVPGMKRRPSLPRCDLQCSSTPFEA